MINFGNIDYKNCPTVLLWPRPIPLISAVALKVIADAFEDGDEMVNCSQTCRIYLHFMDKKFDTMNPDGFSRFNGPIFSFYNLILCVTSLVLFEPA